MTDFTILSAPRIGLGVFTKTLVDAHSPINATAAWGSCLSAGVDPALALAQWLHESRYGTLGVAVTHRNPGNLRQSPGVPQINGFAQFPTWQAGVQGYVNLIAGPLYGKSVAYRTARTMPFRYAPSADHNNPTAYGQALVTSMEGWIALTPPPPDTGTGLIALPDGAKLYAHAGDALPIGEMTHDYGALPDPKVAPRNGRILVTIRAWVEEPS